MADKLRYTVIIEPGPPGSNYSAYVPDLPGCITTGKNLEEVKRNLVEAVELHLHRLREDGEVIPAPSAFADCVEVPNDPAAWKERVVDVGSARPTRRERA